MCRGFFSSDRGHPLIRGGVICPALEGGKETQFLLDTGADMTCIEKSTALDLGVHPEQLDSDEYKRETASGYSGSSVSFRITKTFLLAFEEEVNPGELWEIHVEYLPYIVVSDEIPLNVVGRDIIDRFRMKYDRRDGSISLGRLESGEGQFQVVQIDSPRLEHLSDGGEEHL